MKEVAKFFSGFAGNQVLTHAVLAVSGSRFSVLGIDYTPDLHTAAAIFWGVLMLLLIRYAWFGARDDTRTDRYRPQPRISDQCDRSTET